MDSNQIIAMNLRRFRTAKGLYIKDLGEKSGITRNALSSIENVKTTEPRVSTLQKIAKALDISIYDLLAEPPELSTVRFRTNKLATKEQQALRRQYITDAAVWLENINYLEGLLKIQPVGIFNKITSQAAGLPRKDPIKIAGMTRSMLGLSDIEPIGDILNLIEHAGIKVKLSEFKLDHFFGFSIGPADGGPAILVNSRKGISIERQIFTIAHELGHLLLHPHTYQQDELHDNELEEKEANRFASHFLMPQVAFEKKIDETYGINFVDRVLHIKRYFGVSYEVVLLRRSEMKKESPAILIKKFRGIYKNQYGKSLQDHYEPAGLDRLDLMEDNLLTLVRRALDDERISISKAAEILNISVSKMREQMNVWEPAA